MKYRIALTQQTILALEWLEASAKQSKNATAAKAYAFARMAGDIREVTGELADYATFCPNKSDRESILADVRKGEELKNTRTFYAIKLADTPRRKRWALYRMEKGEMEIVWPAHDKRKKADLLPHQVFSSLRSLPAYHFVTDSDGMDHLVSLAQSLAYHFKCPVEIIYLQGAYPESKLYTPSK